jgi:hypothetical protein
VVSKKQTNKTSIQRAKRNRQLATCVTTTKILCDRPVALESAAGLVSVGHFRVQLCKDGLRRLVKVRVPVEGATLQARYRVRGWSAGVLLRRWTACNHERVRAHLHMHAHALTLTHPPTRPPTYQTTHPQTLIAALYVHVGSPAACSPVRWCCSWRTSSPCRSSRREDRATGWPPPPSR